MAEDDRDEEREREREREREKEAELERVGEDETGDGPPPSEETQEIPTEGQAEEWEEGEEDRPVGEAAADAAADEKDGSDGEE